MIYQICLFSISILTVVRAASHQDDKQAAPVVGGVTQCPPLSVVHFVRSARSALSGHPAFTISGDDIACAEHCRSNRNPLTGTVFPCAAFNYDAGGTCSFFSNAAAPTGTGNLEPSPPSESYYYEKACLPGGRHGACAYRSAAFDRMRNTKLEGFVKRAVPVASMEECAMRCMQESQFTCKSANYHHNNKFCELSDQDRRSKPQYMRTAYGAPMDYFDNNCLTRQNRCGPGMAGGNLIFIKSKNFEIHKFDQSASVEPSESHCLQKCLDASNVMCRSAEYDEYSKKCILSSEDTYSRADQQGPAKGDHGKKSYGKTYYEPMCIASDLSSSTCRQKSAFTKIIGHAIQGTVIATANQVTIADCVSLCFENMHCKSINYDRTRLQCYVFGESKKGGAELILNPAVDYYEFNCESQFGGIALCTNEGIKFIVNTKEPYTGAIYAAERFATCSKIVTNARRITLLFPPPTVNGNCGTVLRSGRLEADVVVSLDGVLPHQVTTEWDRFYRVSCDTSLAGLGEGSVVVTTIFDTADANPQILPHATPGPVTASLMFVDKDNEMIDTTAIGEEILLVAKSPDAGPRNMMLVDCTAARLGGDGQSIPFKVIDNGCPTYPALVGPVMRDFVNGRLAAPMKAFRLDGSFDIQITCTVMFCAGPNGCPPSNCLDASTYQIFQSYGRKKRSVSNNTVRYEDVDGREEQLTAYIRVLAEGEEADDLPPTSSAWAQRSANLIEVSSTYPDEMMCIDEASFVAIIVTVSLLCVLFSGVIVAWGCSRFKGSPSRVQDSPDGLHETDVYSTLTTSTNKQSSRPTLPSTIDSKSVSVLPE